MPTPPPPKPDHVAHGIRISENAKRRKEAGILLPRQERFVQLYVSGKYSNNKAAQLAGYTVKQAPKTAMRLLADPIVQKRIHDLSVEAGRRNDVSLDEVIKGLRQSRDEALEAGQYSAAIRATELLGKYLGMFSDKVNVNIPQLPSIGKAGDLKRIKNIAGLSSNES